LFDSLILKKLDKPMRFTLRQISYFVATAETGSITLASERGKGSASCARRKLC
jgi:hypothetical protein